jgi:predicted MFS family arabinose efflux permease
VTEGRSTSSVAPHHDVAVSEGTTHSNSIARTNRRRIGGLLRQRDYGLFWLGESVNRLGTAVVSVVLPLFALNTLHAGPLGVGILMAATWAPWLLIGLPAGALVDRMPPKPVLIAAGAVSAIALAGLTVATWAGMASVPLLLVAALLVGVAGVFASTASVVYWPSLVTRDDLVEGNAKLQASESAALILGPSLGGALSQAAGPETGVLAAAIGFACSIGCLLGIRHTRKAIKREQRRGLLQDIREGVRIVAHDALLRVLTLNATLANLAGSAGEVLVIVFLVRTVGVTSGTAGLLLALWGVGGLVGALVARRVAALLGTARTLVATAVLTAPFGLLVPLTMPGPGLALFAIGAIVPLVGITVYNTVAGAFRQDYCRPETLGRVTATMRLMLFGAVPVGALLGGTLGQQLGPRGALWVSVAMSLLPSVLLLLSPIARMRDLPVREAKVLDTEG